MRLFSILAALVVSVVLAMSILARPQWMALFGAPAPDETASYTPASVEQEAEPDAAAANLVKVRVSKVIGQQVDSAVIIRGETQAARQVDVRSETSAIVTSAPIRKGSSVAAGDIMCELDPGTRGAALAEARARLAEARSGILEAEARVEEARARLDEAEINQNAATRLGQDGFASQTRGAGDRKRVV